MSEKSKALVARIPLEVFNEGRIDVVDEVVHPDFVDHWSMGPGAPADREGLKLFAARIRQAFPDLHNTIDQMVAEGDLVAAHVVTTGTMRGEFAGMPPTGKQATWEAMHLMRVQDGRLVEHWAVADQLGMMVQLGFVQLPAGMAEPTG